jgi:hypothetical protein
MRALAAILGLTLLLLGCGDGRRYEQTVGVLIDTSGTYADQREDVVRLIKREILPEMLPGDSLVVIRIDSESYDRDNLEALVTFDRRPSHANAQKLALARKLDEFARTPAGSRYSDIPGAMMLAGEYLAEIGSGSRVMLVFSDMSEELPAGVQRRLRDDEFKGVRIAAINVKRLSEDTADPDVFRARLAAWKRRVTNAGALEWRTVLDPNKLPSYLEEVREG